MHRHDTNAAMGGRMDSLDEILQPVLARIEPLNPVMVPVEAAIGGYLAEALVSQIALPARATALRSGLAVQALDLAGASMHAPVILMSLPKRVAAGDPLPDGCDAVMDPRSIAQQGPFWEATESIEPGSDTRFAGHDLAPGSLIGAIGRRVTPELALAARRIGLNSLPLRQPRARIEGFHGPEALWLEARLLALGAVIEAADAPLPDVLIRRNDDAEARLALRPADTAWIELRSGCVVIEVPSRIDTIVAAWCALLLPAFAALTGATMQATEMPLSRKLTSAVGWSEVVIYRAGDHAAEPLACGDFPLSAIIRANAFGLIPAGFEGFASGAPVALTALDRPFL
jgi:molybdopterin biosynthesis enzyme